MIAHIHKSDRQEQSLFEHCHSVASLASRALAHLSLGKIMKLIGLLHDQGKATRAFGDYLIESCNHPEKKLPKGAPHAPTGAIFAYERWYQGDRIQKLTAQLISMAIYGHHAGLPDCLDDKGESPYRSGLSQERKREVSYDEAVDNYLREVADVQTLDALFHAACAEVEAFCQGMNREVRNFQVGMLARLLLSALVDADRWDSACFERRVIPEPPMEVPPDWADLLARLEAYSKRTFTDDSELARLRARISQVCAKGAVLPPGIYRLTVPTGGGKTLSSLRFALAHADGKARRIFYIIPFNTILDQNAQDIREALDHYDVLEHHSGVVKESEEEEEAYTLLTERWDSDIILTSMVQFMNALFRAENTSARRMQALTRSILIFDEIQALPKRCTKLFEEAIRFLVDRCGCTVLLCTATQPQLELPGHELIEDVPELFRQLKRVRYVDESQIRRDNERAAADLCALLQEHKSVLAVVNTKAVALDLFKRVRALAGQETACVHLSTLMCPAHRLKVLKAIKERTGGENPLPTFCVSTALIEAGVNISFPAVVRSLTGLPSIIQAGGRCNRNRERDCGTVYIWNLPEENLRSLRDIRKGREISDAVLRYYHAFADRIGDPDVMEAYFEKERVEYKDELCYPYSPWDTNLYKMLSTNPKGCNAARDRNDGIAQQLQYPHGFRTAGQAFHVIDEATRGILVPYGKGEEIITDLAGEHSMQDEIRLIRQAQQYSVNVYEQTFRKLLEQGALVSMGKTGAVALRKEFYSDETGVCLEPGALEFLCP